MIGIEKVKNKYPDIIDRDLLLEKWDFILKEYQDDEEMTRLLTVFKAIIKLLPGENIDKLYHKVHDNEGYME